MLAVGLTVAVLLAIQLTALARAGGGNNYVPPPSSTHSGSSGSGSSSGGGSTYYYSGGSSSGSGSGSVLLTVFGILVVGIFLTAGVVQWWRRQQATGSSASDSQQAPPAIDRDSVAQGLAALQSRDPNFNPQLFLDRAQTTFFALQNAWMQRNLDPARIYLSDGIYQRWKLQVDQMLAQHKRDVLENLVIGGCAIARVMGDANVDAITVRMDASGADYDVDDFNKIVRGDRTPRPFTEYWTFVRSQAARTRVGEGAQITQCPNCGAPVQVNEAGTCAYCKATVTTGQFGWVLDSITQASQWSAAA